MDDREYRHARANAEAAAIMFRKALAGMEMTPEKRKRIEEQLAISEARMADLDAAYTAARGTAPPKTDAA